MGREGQQMPQMSPEFVESVSARYIELYEHITGQAFVKEPDSDLKARIATNVVDCIHNISL